jgi:outer membrane protein assembly factor BamE (lipoprotein component of BamABCDE complex)
MTAPTCPARGVASAHRAGRRNFGFMELRMIRFAGIAAMALAAAGCAGVNMHKGAVFDSQLVSSIQPGVDNKESVEKLLGRPSFAGQFNDSEWYYVSRDTKQVAFRNPRVQRQTNLVVRFDKAGNVVGVDRTGKNLVASIDPVDRKTPTLGRQRSFFDEIFGNIGSVGGLGNANGGGPGQ